MVEQNQKTKKTRIAKAKDNQLEDWEQKVEEICESELKECIGKDKSFDCD